MMRRMLGTPVKGPSIEKKRKYIRRETRGVSPTAFPLPISEDEEGEYAGEAILTKIGTVDILSKKCLFGNREFC